MRQEVGPTPVSQTASWNGLSRPNPFCDLPVQAKRHFGELRTMLKLVAGPSHMGTRNGSDQQRDAPCGTQQPRSPGPAPSHPPSLPLLTPEISMARVVGAEAGPDELLTSTTPPRHGTFWELCGTSEHGGGRGVASCGDRRWRPLWFCFPGAQHRFHSSRTRVRGGPGVCCAASGPQVDTGSL